MNLKYFKFNAGFYRHRFGAPIKSFIFLSLAKIVMENSFSKSWIELDFSYFLYF